MALAPRAGLLQGDDVLQTYQLNRALRRSDKTTSREEWAKALLAGNTNGAPVRSPLEGLAKALTAGIGGYHLGAAEREGVDQDNMMLADLLGQRSQQQAEEQRQLAGAGVPGFTMPPAQVQPGVPRPQPTAMGGDVTVPPGADPVTPAPRPVDAALIQAVSAMAAGGNKAAGGALPGLQYQYGDTRDREREDRAERLAREREARADARAAARGADANTTGLVPVFGWRDGKRVALFPNGRGGFVEADTGGVDLSKKTTTLDAGTERLVINSETGEVIARYPIAIADREKQAVLGKAAGSAEVEAPQVVRAAEQTVGLIDGLLQHPGLKMGTGGAGVLLNRVPGTPTYDFAQRVEQIQGRAFLEAFESLKGGGAITQIEGEKATQAIARLRTAQSEAAFREALTELRTITMAARDRAIARGGAGAQGVPLPGGAGTATPPPPALPPPPPGFTVR